MSSYIVSCTGCRIEGSTGLGVATAKFQLYMKGICAQVLKISNCSVFNEHTCPNSGFHLQ